MSLDSYRMRGFNKELFLYLMVGGVTYLLDVSISFLLFHQTPLKETVAATTGFLISLLVSYILNSRYVFPHSRGGKKQLVLFLSSTLIIGFICNTLLLPILSNQLGMNFEVSKHAIILIMIVTNYLVRKFFIYKPKSI